MRRHGQQVHDLRWRVDDDRFEDARGFSGFEPRRGHQRGHRRMRLDVCVEKRPKPVEMIGAGRHRHQRAVIARSPHIGRIDRGNMQSTRSIECGRNGVCAGSPTQWTSGRDVAILTPGRMSTP